MKRAFTLDKDCLSIFSSGYKKCFSRQTHGSYMIETIKDIKVNGMTSREKVCLNHNEHAIYSI